MNVPFKEGIIRKTFYYFPITHGQFSYEQPVLLQSARIK